MRAKVKTVGIYVHIPFCLAKCYYCDFTSFAGRNEREKEAYLLALEKEGRVYRELFPGLIGKSLYIGGGTPTCLTSGQIFILFRMLNALFKLPVGIEITVEGNPGTLKRNKLLRLREVGCNRLSLGVQSFHSRDLKALGRIHSLREVYTTYELARQVGFDNINLDLMYGLPSQDLKGWQDNLQKVVELHPEHISLYQLNIEQDTLFAQLAAKGLLKKFDQDLAYQMYAEAINYLEAKGYHHYEISNFALPGKEAFHNRLYWLNEEYLGLGAGAAGYLQGIRYTNIGNPVAYQEWLAQSQLPIAEKEIIHAELAMAETMFLGLRLLKGVNKTDFRRKHGISIENKYQVILDKLITQGLLQETDTHIALTKRGMYVANEVMQEFL
jgi:oxygen-independent coproporphyrinogen-3 oxidase